MRTVRNLISILLASVLISVSASAVNSVGENSEIPFPPDFWWGTSMAAHQSEGGNHNSWTEWEDIPGHIKNGDKSGLADDHWNRFEEDFDNLVWLNANTQRFSIEWSRLEPEPGQWNDEAVLHYRQMILALKKRNIRPVICLFHFTLPVWAAEKGGFENPEIMDAFVEFSKKPSGLSAIW